jgi:hypothetical protein
MSGSSVTLLDVINALRGDDGEAPLVPPQPQVKLGPYRPAHEPFVTKTTTGDLHACRSCGRPVFETASGSLYDDRTLWHLHQCEALAVQVIAPPPLPSVPSPRSAASPPASAPHRFTGGVAI